MSVAFVLPPSSFAATEFGDDTFDFCEIRMLAMMRYVIRALLPVSMSFADT